MSSVCQVHVEDGPPLSFVEPKAGSSCHLSVVSLTALYSYTARRLHCYTFATVIFYTGTDSALGLTRLE